MDAGLRAAEQAWLAAPSDGSAARRYARLLMRAERYAEACEVLGPIREQVCAPHGIIWRASPARVRTTSYSKLSRPYLKAKGQALSVEELARMVSEDLDRFDPALLMQHFPRRADGEVRLMTTLFLRRYPAGAPRYPGSSLVLMATTGDSLTRKERKERRVAVELQVRRLKPSFAHWLLPDEQWRS